MPEQNAHYTVLARRFRPQAFDEVIGQQPVAQALQNAIRHGRVAHAYLFTGARGVGKTSMARILAKALNCPYVKDGVPCNECDICQSISAGHDVDVLEIDGASNRGIDDIRSLRANVNVKPMRARQKIYIIDEVHMLTTDAFNALLKTLEEPPPNVKFVFCTTEPHKLLDTILSRCQRFDFATIETANIMARLAEIAQKEGYEVSSEALELVARRADGSMRDSQSLFDQLLAFSDGKITPDDVHRLLGTASDDRLIAIVGALIDRRSDSALKQLDEALAEGVQLGELADQILRYLRDVMVVAVGAEGVKLSSVSGDHRNAVAEHAQRWGLNTVMAALQILSETRSQMSRVTYGRVLAEMALVRISLLENLEELQQVIKALTGTNGKLTLPVAVSANLPAAAQESAPAPARKTPVSQEAKTAPSKSPAPEKKNENAEQSMPTGGDSSEFAQDLNKISEDLQGKILPQLVSIIGDALQAHVKTLGAIAISGPNRLDLQFSKSYDFSRRICEKPENRDQLKRVLSQIVGRPVEISIGLLPEIAEETTSPPATPDRPQPKRAVAPDPEDHPFVNRAMEVFGASLVTVESLMKPVPAPAGDPVETDPIE